MTEEAWDEGGTRRVTVSFSVEIGAKDDRSSAEIAEAIMAEYGHRGGDATMFLEPVPTAPIGHEEVLQHLLADHGEHLRTTTDPLSLGDFVTVNYVNPLYARATSPSEGAIGRLERFVASGGDTEVLLEGLGNPSALVVGNPVDGVRLYGPFRYPEDADGFAEAELRHQEWWSVELHRP